MRVISRYLLPVLAAVIMTGCSLRTQAPAPVDQAGVAGLARAWVMGQGGALERRLSPADVEGADALFLCNAVRGIHPVGRLGARTWAPHPATRALQAELGRQWPAFARED